jgi:hypothetical protein
MADKAILLKATENNKLVPKQEYQRRIRSVIHPMVYTRPDIAFTVGKLVQFIDKPTTTHKKCIKVLI